MADPPPPEIKLPDPVQWSRDIAEIAERSQRLVLEFLARQSGGGVGMADPLNVAGAFLDMTSRMMAHPEKLIQAQMSLWQDYLVLWQRTAERFWSGRIDQPMVEPAASDRRFKDAAWSDGTLFDFIKQSYLLTARWLQSTVKEVDGLDEKTARKVDFYTRQFVDAMAPSNFLLTNPEVLRTTIESGGENLVNGLKHVLEDLERGNGRLMIKMTDMDAFKIGENIAVTPGKVVYQNDLMQLLQYAPTTAKVKRRPLLIIPPWINKFYILDLRPRELLHQMGGRPGPYRLRRLLGQSGRASRAQGFRRLHARRSARRARRHGSRPPASARPTSSATASAARCSPRRWPIWRPRATTASRAPPISSR